MNDFASFFYRASLHWTELPAQFACMYIKETICYWSFFLSKQQIFSPGLLTRPVLIMSVAENGVGVKWKDGGMEVQLFSLLFYFAANLFLPMYCRLLGQGGGFLQ